MSPVRTDIRALQVVLIVAAAALTLVGFLCSNQNLTLWPAPWGFVGNGDVEHPIILGVINLTHLGFFLGFLLLYLCFEFYGFRSGFYGVIALSVMMAGVYFLYSAMKDLSLSARFSYCDRRIFSMFLIERREMVAGVAAYAVGFGFIFVLAAALRRLTRDYFMFFRFPIASAAGLAVFVLVKTALLGGGGSNPEAFIIPAITPVLQFAGMTVAAIVPLYLMRLALAAFRGRDSISLPPAPPPAPRSVSQPETFVAPRPPGPFRRLIVTPVLFGAVAGALAFAVPPVFRHRVFQNIPDFYGLFPPIMSYALSIATILAGIALFARLVSLAFEAAWRSLKDRRHSRRGGKSSAVNAEEEEEEDTVSEKTPAGSRA